MNNSVEALTLLKTGHQGLLKLHVPLRDRFQCEEKKISKKGILLEATKQHVRSLFKMY